VQTTVRDVILVGFEQLGVDTRLGRQWYERTFPSS
jgi:hypothetical protein